MIVEEMELIAKVGELSSRQKSGEARKNLAMKLSDVVADEVVSATLERGSATSHVT